DRAYLWEQPWPSVGAAMAAIAAIAAPTGGLLPAAPGRSVLRARRPGDQLAQALADAAEQRRGLLRRRRRRLGRGGLLRLRLAQLALPTRLPATASAFPAAFALHLPVLRLLRVAFAV